MGCTGRIVLSRFAVASVMTVLALFVSQLARAEELVEACSNPPFPGSRTAIDEQCGVEGSGGEEAAQNAIKNNFCASSPPAAMTFARLRELQSSVEHDAQINFGDRANHGSHGPTTDRAPLTALGEGRLVQLKGFVLAAKQEGAESVNCGHEFDDVANKNSFHDIHISMVETRELASPADPSEEAANECQGIVVEMVPHHRPKMWTPTSVRKVRDAHVMVRVTGQLFFDSSHVPCADGSGVRSNPKRFSLWEIHPIYAFEVCTANCDQEGTWVSLEQWLQQQ